MPLGSNQEMILSISSTEADKFLTNNAHSFTLEAYPRPWLVQAQLLRITFTFIVSDRGEQLANANLMALLLE